MTLMKRPGAWEKPFSSNQPQIPSHTRLTYIPILVFPALGLAEPSRCWWMTKTQKRCVHVCESKPKKYRPCCSHLIFTHSSLEAISPPSGETNFSSSLQLEVFFVAFLVGGTRCT